MTANPARIDSLHQVPNYGIDGPGFAVGFFATGLPAMVAGLWLCVVAEGWLLAVGFLLLILSIVPIGLGTTMLVYAIAGKQRLRDHLLAQNIWRGDEIVIDIGSGRGLMAVGAAHRVPMGKVFAVDIWSSKDLTGNSPAGLMENAGLEGVGQRIEIVSRDASRLDFADASVDVVVSVFCLHNIEPVGKRHDACREIARVLKPGGMAMIADFPSVGEYRPVFEAAGLSVRGPFRAEAISWGISGYLVAEKRG